MFSFLKRTISQLEEEKRQQASAPLLTPDSEPSSIDTGVKFEQQGAQLEDILHVIETTEPERLILVLKELVKKAPDATIPIVLKQLFAEQPSPVQAGNEISNGSQESDGLAKKRKRSNTKGDAEKVESQEGSKPRKAARRYEICQNCDEEYDITDNGGEDCQYHAGKQSRDFLSYYSIQSANPDPQLIKNCARIVPSGWKMRNTILAHKRIT
jgi:hypothetical protein